MSHVTKLVLRIVINRGRTLHEIAPEQYGFMPDKGTGNAMFVLRMLVERSIEKQKYVCVCFIDYSKAFAYGETQVDGGPITITGYQAELRLLISLYWKQTAVVRCDDDNSAWTSIKQGVRQECVASPHLFASYTEMIMKEL